MASFPSRVRGCPDNSSRPVTSRRSRSRRHSRRRRTRQSRCGACHAFRSRLRPKRPTRPWRRLAEPAVGKETGPVAHRMINELPETTTTSEAARVRASPAFSDPRPETFGAATLGSRSASTSESMETLAAAHGEPNRAPNRSIDNAPEIEPTGATSASLKAAPKAPPLHAPKAELRPANAFAPTAAHSASPRAGARGTAIGEAPVIHVTIGRVDVRAVTPAPAEPPPIVPAKPRATLDDYLARTRRR